jgi:hypothetical protein
LAFFARLFRPLVVLSILIAGCHSASFQTARIRNGINTVVGVTRVDEDANPDISNYSVFIKGEMGRSAREERFGYSFGLTLVGPLKNRYRDLFTSEDMESGTFPNEWAGVLPELKLQLPRLVPVDIAFDLRFMAVVPERFSQLASYELNDHITFYESFSYTTAIGQLLSVGAEINLNPKMSLMFEYSRWLSQHDYPADFEDPAPRYPYTIGIAFSYHLIKTATKYDLHDLATQTGSEPGN